MRSIRTNELLPDLNGKIFDILQLTQTERDAVYEAVIEGM